MLAVEQRDPNLIRIPRGIQSKLVPEIHYTVCIRRNGSENEFMLLIQRDFLLHFLQAAIISAHTGAQREEGEIQHALSLLKAAGSREGEAASSAAVRAQERSLCNCVWTSPSRGKRSTAEQRALRREAGTTYAGMQVISYWQRTSLSAQAVLF